MTVNDKYFCDNQIRISPSFNQNGRFYDRTTQNPSVGERGAILAGTILEGVTAQSPQPSPSCTTRLCKAVARLCGRLLGCCKRSARSAPSAQQALPSPLAESRDLSLISVPQPVDSPNTSNDETVHFVVDLPSQGGRQSSRAEEEEKSARRKVLKPANLSVHPSSSITPIHQTAHRIANYDPIFGTESKSARADSPRIGVGHQLPQRKMFFNSDLRIFTGNL